MAQKRLSISRVTVGIWVVMAVLVVLSAQACLAAHALVSSLRTLLLGLKVVLDGSACCKCVNSSFFNSVQHGAATAVLAGHGGQHLIQRGGCGGAWC